MRTTATINITATTNIMKLSSLVLFFALAGCSFFSGSSSDQGPNIVWKKNGAIVLSRVAPAPAAAAESKGALLGFLPEKSRTTMHWLRVNKSTRTIEVMNGDQTIVSVASDGIERLEPGRYQVIHKQKDPLWYAPDTYFTARLLNVPAEGSKERYRKGALGDFVVYFDSKVPIHSSPVACDEVGGVRLSSVDMSRLYYSLDIGSAVEIR